MSKQAKWRKYISTHPRLRYFLISKFQEKSFDYKTAVVLFSNKEDAKKAMLLNGEVQWKKHLKITPIVQQQEFKHTIVVSDLPYELIEEHLWRIFEVFGKIKAITINRIITPTKSASAYISFHTKAARIKAMEENVTLENKRLKIKKALTEAKMAEIAAKKAEKLREEQIKRMEQLEEEHGHAEENEDIDFQGVENPDVEFKNIRGFKSKKKQRRFMDELMGKTRKKLSKETKSLAITVKEEKKKKREDRENREKRNKDNVKRIKLKIKKI